VIRHTPLAPPDPHRAATAPARIRALEAELAEARAALHAIGRGAVDAVVVPDAEGAARVYTLDSTDRPYRHLIERIQEGAVTLAHDGTLLFANRRVAELLGLPPEQVVGQDLAGFVALRDAPSWRRLLAQARRGGGRGELTLHRTDGVEVPVFASLSPLDGEGDDDGEGGPQLCGVLTDLTQHKLRLRAADEANARLRQAMAEREHAEEALRQAQKMQAIGQLTGGIAHDFNNMLQGFASGIELMRRRLVQDRPAEALRYLDAVLAGIDRAASLTQRLLAFSRRQTLLPRPVDSAGLLRDMSGLIGQTVGPEITVALKLDEAAPPMLCDRNQLESALLNLAINARDAMLPLGGGTLTLATETVQLGTAQIVGFGAARPGPFVRLTVADTGTGMTEDVLGRAFDPFFTTKPAGQGTGLGLSQVWGFVAQSGGVLRVVSAPGQGAIIHLHLPCDPDAAVPAPPPDAAPPTPEAAPRAARALLVDDEPQVRAALAEALDELGWQVAQAGTGAEALERLRDHPAPDILVADIGLPGGMNGRQLAEAARALHPALPILLITGYAGAALGPDAPLPPGAQLLHKPFTLGVLAGRVQALVPRRG
jgi:PAS domain S-box-containing protein